jgi:transcriptional regulator with PAS, ATPase and Fis domain
MGARVASINASAPSRHAGPSIVGESRIVRELLETARWVANASGKVLITGESGVGKELVAAYVHANSRRASRPFVAVNCAGFSDGLLESELFGHVRGSFTGALRDRPGKFEAAHRGTLFLDEVGEMTMRMQGLMLRVLETGEIAKVGSEITSAVDCRVLAATNRNLPQMIEKGLFRRDLYYRLNVLSIHVAPLRDHPEDIPLLGDAFLEQFAAQTGCQRRFSPDVYAVLQRYGWPGNVRQLENTVHRLAVNAAREQIDVEDLPSEVARDVPRAPNARRVERRRASGAVLYERILAGQSFWEVCHSHYLRRDLTKHDVRGVVSLALEQSHGSYKGATRLLNIEALEYKRFLNFLRKHGCLVPYRVYR